MDKEAPDNILEVTARAITYYLDVSVDCTRRITAVDGALKAIITRMKAANVRSRTSKDLAEQCVKVSRENRVFLVHMRSICHYRIKCMLMPLYLVLPCSLDSLIYYSQVLELACARESDKVFDAGGLPAIMAMLIEHDKYLHRDTLQSCMNVVTRLIPRMEPKDPSMDSCISSLSTLLSNEDAQISEPAMKCFVGLADRFIRRGKDPAPIVEKGLIEELIRRLSQVGHSLASGQGGSGATPEKPSGHSVTTIINLLSTLCRGSPNITHVRR